jgi:aerobic carbon-monoxide dehydrogenase large subunit
MASEATGKGWVGKNFKRKEDARLTVGQGQFIGDLSEPGMVELVFVRSDRAHARIKSIDVSVAAAMPGVLLVITGEELKDQIRSMPQKVVVPALPARHPTHWPLAVGKVKFHGEPVAAVVARDKYVAEDAAEAVIVNYGEDLPFVGDVATALAPGAPLVHEDWKDNQIFAATFTGGDTVEGQEENARKVDELIRGADAVIKQTFRVHRCGVTPMEPRGTLAKWSESDGLKAWITTQRPHIDRLALADLLDIPAGQVRVIAPRDQGGGFGVKAPFYREPILICHLARKLNRPVRWIETRQEHLMAVSAERDQIHTVELAANNDGKFVAFRTDGVCDCGDACEGVYWGYLMSWLGGVLFTNSYDLPMADIRLRVAVTNKSALSPARSFGSYPTRFAIERMVDMMARKLGLSPVDVRRMNLISELPYTTATGAHYDEGDYLAAWDSLVEHLDLPAFRREQAAARMEGRYIGLGFGTGVECSGMASEILVPMENQPGYGAASVRLDPRGKALVSFGDAAQGQGHETTIAQVAAHEFGIHPNDIIVREGDTETTPFGSGTIGARTGSYIMSGVSTACRVLKDKMCKVLANDLDLDATAEDFEFDSGDIILRRDPNIRRSFQEVAERIIMAPLDLPEGMEGGLEHTSFFEAPSRMMSFSVHAAKVEVSAETGQFKILNYVTCEDIGTLINPQIVEGQVQGGVVQGLSNAMFEEFVYDSNGQCITADFENYKLATAADMPSVEVTHSTTLCPHTPLGQRGLGEGIPGPVPGALSNAVCDALEPFGVEITDLPLRPNSIWRQIQASKARQEADKNAAD